TAANHSPILSLRPSRSLRELILNLNCMVTTEGEGRVRGIAVRTNKCAQKVPVAPPNSTQRLLLSFWHAHWAQMRSEARKMRISFDVDDTLVCPGARTRDPAVLPGVLGEFFCEPLRAGTRSLI